MKNRVTGTKRVKLLKAFSEKEYSLNTQEKIAQTFVFIPEEQREAHAQKILDIINSSESEEEILDKIRNR